jgi:nucleoid-associated protein YgaU
MSQPVVYLLLFLALVLPVPGAIVVRLLAGRLGERGVLLGSAAVFTVAIASVLALARADIGALRVGDLTLFVQTARRDEAPPPPDAVAPAAPDVPPDAAPPLPPTLTLRPSATPRPTATPSPSATPEATATPEPTATATPEPPTATPEPQAGPQRYTVQPGDSLRGIAERFGVTVAALLEANDLTPAEADSLRPGQELIIP